MNKKMIIGLVAGILAVAVVVVGIVFTVKKLSKVSDEPKENTSSDVSSDTSSTTSVSDGTSVVEKGNLGIESVKTKSGKEFSVPVKMSENPGFYAGEFYFIYDADALDYVDYEKGNIVDGYTVEKIEDGTVACILECNGNSDTKKTGTLMTLNFVAKKDAKPGEYTVKLSDKTMLANYDEMIVAPKISAGKITIE